jgi:hypothetical protein
VTGSEKLSERKTLVFGPTGPFQPVIPVMFAVVLELAGVTGNESKKIDINKAKTLRTIPLKLVNDILVLRALHELG